MRVMSRSFLRQSGSAAADRHRHLNRFKDYSRNSESTTLTHLSNHLEAAILEKQADEEAYAVDRHWDHLVLQIRPPRRCVAHADLGGCGFHMGDTGGGLRSVGQRAQEQLNHGEKKMA